MRRIRIPLFAIVSIISLLLCAATITLWIRSYYGSDYISRNIFVNAEPHAINTRVHALTFTRGLLRFSSVNQTFYADSPIPNPGPSRAPVWSYGRLGARHLGWDYFERSNHNWFNHFGFHVYETGWESSFMGTHERIIAIPAALPAIIFAILPAAWLVKVIRRRRRNRAGLCPNCGYDIRATPQRCPECGRVTLANH